MVSRKRGKSGGHRDCGRGEVMVLVCDVTSCHHLFKVLCDLMGRNPS